MKAADGRLRLVLDTNVLFSATAFGRDSPPAGILSLARRGAVRTFVSGFILDELERNLLRKAGWERTRVRSLRRELRGFLSVIEPSARVDAIRRNEADNRILECAVAAGADVLVTGDRRDIRPLGTFAGILILTPREFLDARERGGIIRP
jgi:uncharacterized protein